MKKFEIDKEIRIDYKTKKVETIFTLWHGHNIVKTYIKKVNIVTNKGYIMSGFRLNGDMVTRGWDYEVEA